MGLKARRAGALAVCLTAWTGFFPAQASDSPLIPPALRERMFAFGGFDVAKDSSSVWMGLVASPMQRMDQDGPLLRIMGGYGRYSYKTSTVPGGVNDGEYTSGEFMLGWRHDFSRVIVTAYVGAHMENHTLANPDPGNKTAGTETGVKGIVEVFTRPAQEWIASASASISSVYTSYSLRGLIAREVNPKLTLGLEAALLGNERYHEPRAGIAANIMLSRNILAMSAGALDNSDKGSGAYFTMSLYAPF